MCNCDQYGHPVESLIENLGIRQRHLGVAEPFKREGHLKEDATARIQKPAGSLSVQKCQDLHTFLPAGKVRK
jgi:hypothetical protein